MKSNSNVTDPAGGKPPRFGIGSFLFIVALAVILFLLAQSMVRHHLHVGGRLNRNGTISQ